MIDLRLATAHEPSHPSVFNGCPHFNFKPTTYEEAVSRSSSRSSWIVVLVLVVVVVVVKP